MQHDDSCARNSASRVGRSQRRLRSKDRSTRRNVDEVGQHFSATQREAHRKIIAALPTLSVESCIDRLPNPVITHMSVDDVCKETMVIVDLLTNDNIEIV